MCSYNFKNEVKPLYCVTHRQPDMVDVFSKHCIAPDCWVRAHFNFENEKPLYCNQHKQENMIFVKKASKCLNCNKRPSYNFENEKNPIYCKEHKSPEMIDVHHTNCKVENCQIRPVFNYKDTKFGLYCLEHKLDEMIDVCSYTCIIEDCKSRPHYNYRDMKPLYCGLHRLPDMINVTIKYCITPFCDGIAKLKYRGHCLYCFSQLFPDEPNSRNYKTKERAVIEEIIQQFPNLSWIIDKRIQDGCSKRRPDMFLDLGSHVLLIEVDEEQHKTYNCESKRIMEISRDIDHRPLVCIRFNPDSYYDNEHMLRRACWGVNGFGVCSIKNKTEWKKRINKLIEMVNYYIHNSIDKTIHFEYLFYDDE
jgi:hypothetical protein